MKKGIHPEYRAVVFQDPSCDFAILSKSTIKSKETVKFEWDESTTYVGNTSIDEKDGKVFL